MEVSEVIKLFLIPLREDPRMKVYKEEIKALLISYYTKAIKKEITSSFSKPHSQNMT